MIFCKPNLGSKSRFLARKFNKLILRKKSVVNWILKPNLTEDFELKNVEKIEFLPGNW